MDENMNGQLTQEDIKARAQQEVVDKLKLQLPENLALAIAEEERIVEERGHLRKVPEYIFRRDILPAVSGDLGPVSMSWWIKQFGSPTLGFLVVADSDNNKVLFEFPPLGPNSAAERNSEKKPVGDLVSDYLNRVRNNPKGAELEFKAGLRDYLHVGESVDVIENIAKTERIMRHYGKSILAEAKPQLVEIINAAIEGLDEVLGKLGDPNSVQTVASEAKAATGPQKENSSYDDDGEATAVSYD